MFFANRSLVLFWEVMWSVKQAKQKRVFPEVLERDAGRHLCPEELKEANTGGLGISATCHLRCALSSTERGQGLHARLAFLSCYPWLSPPLWKRLGPFGRLPFPWLPSKESCSSGSSVFFSLLNNLFHYQWVQRQPTRHNSQTPLESRSPS